MKSRILLIEDSDSQRKLTAEVLRARGYEVYEAWSTDSARRLLPSVRPRIVILDLTLEEESGAALLDELPPTTGAIVVSSDASMDTRIGCLEAGALDYMVKPIDHRELVLRVQKLDAFAPVEARATSSVDLGPIRVDLLTRVLTSTATGAECRLTNSEFALLTIFLRSRGSILSRRMLADLMNYQEYDPHSRAIDVLVSKLRGRLKEIGHDRLIWSVRGEGYRLRAEGLTIPAELFDEPSLPSGPNPGRA